ncbi:MAG0110 family membrane protein [Mycoplasmopsis gallinacea]|uniref:Inhibitor of apoptosis-promoting Bax1 n=1 Tax=Mycoplasmopsis gallinacea TaxID=29556 RepID=A0A6H0V5E7_9BACT|nr:hypothetical protein [Mycoplasmopsis gallinacea]QIW62193.1 hypothetical protein GOQ20_01935 [Mycoplasmopsis gallinacea]
MEINTNNYTVETLTKEQAKSKQLFYSTILVSFGLGIVAILSLSLLFFQLLVNNAASFGRSFQMIFYISLFIFVIVNIAGMWLKKFGAIALTIYYPFAILSAAVIAAGAVALYGLSEGANGVYSINKGVINILLILFAPAILIFIFGLIGYFNLFDIRKLSILVGVLSVGLIISMIVSFFVLNSTLEIIIGIVGTIVISGITAVTWFTIRKEADMIQFESNKEIYTKGLYYGIVLYFNYWQIVIFLLRIFTNVGDRR